MSQFKERPVPGTANAVLGKAKRGRNLKLDHDAFSKSFNNGEAIRLDCTPGNQTEKKYFTTQNVILAKRKHPYNLGLNDRIEIRKKIFRVRFVAAPKQRARKNDKLKVEDILAHMKISRKPINAASSALKTATGNSSKKRHRLLQPAPIMKQAERLCVTSTETRGKAAGRIDPKKKEDSDDNNDKKWYNRGNKDRLFKNKDMSFYLNITGFRPVKNKRRLEYRNARNNVTYSKSFCIQDQPPYLRPKIYMVGSGYYANQGSGDEDVGPDKKEDKGVQFGPPKPNVTKPNPIIHERQHNRSAALPDEENKQDIPLYQNVLLKNHMILQKLKAALIANSSKTAEIMFRVCVVKHE